VFAYRRLPIMEGIAIPVYFAVVIALVSGLLEVEWKYLTNCIAKLVVFWVLGDRGGEEVLTTFSDNGWPTNFVSCLVGMLGAVQTFMGSDAQAHLGEETFDAARVVPRFVDAADLREQEDSSDYSTPRAMIATALTNYVIGLSMTVVRRMDWVNHIR
jgi:amino acid transporter